MNFVDQKGIKVRYWRSPCNPGKIQTDVPKIFLLAYLEWKANIFCLYWIQQYQHERRFNCCRWLTKTNESTPYICCIRGDVTAWKWTNLFDVQGGKIYLGVRSRVVDAGGHGRQHGRQHHPRLLWPSQLAGNKYTWSLLSSPRGSRWCTWQSMEGVAAYCSLFSI